MPLPVANCASASRFSAASADGDHHSELSANALERGSSSCASWELVKALSSGPSLPSGACGGSGSGSGGGRRVGGTWAESVDDGASSGCSHTRLDLDPAASSLGCSKGGAVDDEDATCDTANWYPVDSMEIDAAFAQELGLLAVAGSATTDASDAAVTATAIFLAPYISPAVAVASQRHGLEPEGGAIGGGGAVSTSSLKQLGTCAPLPPFGAARQGSSVANSPPAPRSVDVSSWAAAAEERQPPRQVMLSLESFLDEVVPNFPFAPPQHCAAAWKRITA